MSSGHLSLDFIKKIRKGVGTASTSLNLVQAGSVFPDKERLYLWVNKEKSNSEVILAWLAGRKQNHGAVWALGLKAAEPG